MENKTAEMVYETEDHDNILNSLSTGQDVRVEFEHESDYIKVKNELLDEYWDDVTVIERDHNGMYTFDGCQTGSLQTIARWVSKTMEIEYPDFDISIVRGSRYYDSEVRKWVNVLEAGWNWTAGELDPERFKLRNKDLSEQTED